MKSAVVFYGELELKIGNIFEVLPIFLLLSFGLRPFH